MSSLPRPLIVHFVVDHRIGGTHVYIRNLMALLADQFDYRIVTPGSGPMTDMTLPNLRRFSRWLYPLEMLLNIFFSYRLLSRVHKAHPALVVNVHGGANLAPLLAARCMGLVPIWHIHETSRGLRQLVSLGRWLMGRRGQLVVVAQASIDRYRLQHAMVLPSTVDRQFWCADPQSVDVGDQGISTLLSVGNLNPMKGFETLIAALSRLPGTSPTVRLVIAGAPLATQRRYARKLHRQAARVMRTCPGIEVVFAGWQDEQAVRSLMRQCDVFVLCSHSEACPLVILEAIAVGCSILATDVGDVRAMLQQSPAARVVTAGSPAALADALHGMLGATAQSGAFAHNVTPEAWRPETVASQARSLYRRALP